MARGSRAILPLRVIAVPRERGIVFMRGDDNKNASRLKTYGRILNGFYAQLMNPIFQDCR
jgi:hypothetical protein